MIKLHLLDIAERFDSNQIRLVKEAFDKAVGTSAALIEVRAVDVVVYHNPNLVIKRTGIGGSTLTPNLISVPIDATRKFKFDDLYLTICHELHHAVRQGKFGFPATLLDAVISEGLADQFEVEIEPTKHPITFRKDIDKKTLLRGFANLKKQMNSKDYDYYEWFFGKGRYPNWFGYTLGNIIVEAHVESRKIKPSKLVDSRTKTFIASLEAATAALR